MATAMATGAAAGTVRSIAATRIPTCGPGETAAAVRDRLVGEAWESADTIYVVEDGTLRGRIDVADLLGADKGVTAERLMEPATARLRPDADRERAVVLAIRRDRDEIPVVDGDGRLVGAVTAQAIIDAMHREHVEDALLAAGIRRTELRISELVSARVVDAVRSRAPWLLFGLLVGLFLSVISSQFEATMRETVALAFFPPVVAYIADSVGTQSEAIAVRALAVADVDYRAYLLRELLVGVLIGTMIGVLGGAGAALVAGSASIGVVVGCSLFASSAIATVLASLIPIGFVRLDVDPALGSGPLATAVQDVFSIGAYFLFAVTLL